MDIKKCYSIVAGRKRKNKKAPAIRFALLEESGFPGIVIEFRDIKILEEAQPDGTNCQIVYDIKKVPKGKYKNLEDIEKDRFEKIVQGVFLDMIESAVKKVEAPVAPES